MGSTSTHWDWKPENSFASWLIPAAKSAVASPHADRAEWDRKMAAFLRADALTRAYDDFGEGQRVNDEHDRQNLLLEEKYGPGFRSHPQARATLDAQTPRFLQMEEDKSERFYRPLWKAQRELVLTPAPDLAAALFKVELINVAEIWNDNQMPRDCFEIVAEDMARLAGEEA